MIKRIGKQPKNEYSFGSFMSQNSGVLDKANDALYGIASYLNTRDSKKYLDRSPAAAAGVGFDDPSTYVPFTPKTGSFSYLNTDKQAVDAQAGEEYSESNSTILGDNYSQDNGRKYGGNINTFDIGGQKYTQAASAGLKLAGDAISNYKSKSTIKNTNGLFSGIGQLASTQFAGSNEDLLNQWGNTAHYNNIGYKSLLNGSANFTVGDGLQALGASYEGMKGGSGFTAGKTPIGAIIGGVVGGLSSGITSALARNRAKHKAKRAANIANGQGLAANEQAKHSFETAAETNDSEMFRNGLLNYGSMNTGLGTSYGRNTSVAYGGQIFGEGGTMGNHGAVWDTGLTKFNTGGTHEENPNGGVLQGYDEKGVPNYVEEGEYKWEDPSGKYGTYIFSNRLNIPRELVRKYKLGGSAKTGTSFAKGIEKYIKRNSIDNLENDPIQKATTNAFLTILADAQEEVRKEQEMREFVKMLEQLPPEQQQQVLMAMQQQLQQQAQPQEEQMPEEQQMPVEDPMAQQQMQQMPQEEQVPQDQVPMQEQPMVEEQQPMMQEQQIPMGAAYGGQIYAEGGEMNAEMPVEQPQEEEPISTEEYQAQMQQQQQEAQQQEEATSEEQLDDQIDQIIQYAKDTQNKELLAGARKAQRGSIEEKKAFINRANELINFDQRNQEQQNAEQQQAQQQQLQEQQAAIESQQAENPQQMQDTQQFAYGGNIFAKGGQEDDDSDDTDDDPFKSDDLPYSPLYGHLLPEEQQALDYILNKKIRYSYAQSKGFDGQVLPNSESQKNGQKTGTSKIAGIPADPKFRGQAVQALHGSYVRGLENIQAYKDFTDYVKQHAADNDEEGEAIRKYLKELGDASAITPALVDADGNLVDGWEDLWENRRNDGKYGSYHYTPDLYTPSRDEFYIIDPSGGEDIRVGFYPSNSPWSDYYTKYRGNDRVSHPNDDVERHYYTPNENIQYFLRPAGTVGEADTKLEADEALNSSKYTYLENLDETIPTVVPGYKETHKYYTPVVPDATTAGQTEEVSPATTTTDPATTTVVTTDPAGSRAKKVPRAKKENNDKDIKAIFDNIKGGASALFDNINWQALPQLLYQMSHRPNNSYHINAQRQAMNIPLSRLPREGNYIAPMLMDIHGADNRAIGIGNNTIRINQDTSNGNADKLRNANLIANLGMQQGLANNLIEGMKWNAGQYAEAAKHNKSVDDVNLEMAKAEAELAARRGEKIADIFTATGKEMSDSDASWNAGVAQGLGTLFRNNTNKKYDKLNERLLAKLLEEEP